MSATIDVYADVVCPFAYIGLTRVLAHRAAIGRDDVRLRVLPWPLEVVNHEPVDGRFIAEEVAEVAPQVAPDLFTGFDPDAFPSSSLPALALTHAAYRHDDQTGEQVAMALRTALFERGLDISDADVLAGIADAHRIDGYSPEDLEAVQAEYTRGRERGVVGSPHFFTRSLSVFCPVLEIHRVEGTLDVQVDREALASLLEACFEPLES